MKSNEFYEIVEQFQDVFTNHGYRRKGKNKYTFLENYRLEFVLNKWDWIDGYGWKFFIKIIDKRYEDERGIFDYNGYLEIRPSRIQDDGVVSDRSLKEHYDRTPENVKKAFYNDEGISFYNKSDLEDLLKELLPKILTYALEWAKNKDADSTAVPRERTKPNLSDVHNVHKKAQEIDQILADKYPEVELKEERWVTDTDDKTEK
jgi:hypothetical protein